MGDRAIFPMILLHKKCTVFVTVKTRLSWLNNVSGVYLVQVSLLLIGQQGFERFFKYRPFPCLSLEMLHRRRKMTNTVLTTFNALQAASQSTFINTQLYSTCDKNQQLTLLGPCKLAFTGRNM
jgi:hypothetical protein